MPVTHGQRLVGHENVVGVKWGRPEARECGGGLPGQEGDLVDKANGDYKGPRFPSFRSGHI